MGKRGEPQGLDNRPDPSLSRTLLEIAREKGWSHERLLLMVLDHLDRLMDDKPAQSLMDDLEDQDASPPGPPPVAGEVRILRVQEGKKRWWIFFDKTRTLKGEPDEDRADVLMRWKQTYGLPTKKVPYGKYHSPAEAAATIADFQLDD